MQFLIFVVYIPADIRYERCSTTFAEGLYYKYHGRGRMRLQKNPEYWLF